MEQNKDDTPSSNSLKYVKSHTDRTHDQTNDLRGDKTFVDEFSADLSENVYDDAKGPGTLPGEPDGVEINHWKLIYSRLKTAMKPVNHGF